MLQKVQQKNYFKKNVAKVATKKIKSKKCCKKILATNSRIKKILQKLYRLCR